MYRDPSPEAHSAPAGIAAFPQVRRAERHAVDLLVRYAWQGLRATVMLKDLTCFGARIEGIAALRTGDELTLLLPGLPATRATVAWVAGRSAGLTFEQALASAALDELVRDFATPCLNPYSPNAARQNRVA
ncbi:MAG: PilZ domain-containing protein [Sphingomonadales bacterium]|nr:PilZ domain-containing protein [Sphingomonadales bacterium]MBU3992811.1 PilZ domain-containing protein [Alphaproteobacteria bacterium]